MMNDDIMCVSEKLTSFHNLITWPIPVEMIWNFNGVFRNKLKFYVECLMRFFFFVFIFRKRNSIQQKKKRRLKINNIFISKKKKKKKKRKKKKKIRGNYLTISESLSLCSNTTSCQIINEQSLLSIVSISFKRF